VDTVDMDHNFPQHSKIQIQELAPVQTQQYIMDPIVVTIGLLVAAVADLLILRSDYMPSVDLVEVGKEYQIHHR
jgi:hypothetical protein